ncbi:DUF3606 domain-containing protein [Ferruginibacter albus]|uniref:DUF3606 domain-containing protein n=1 Tax=Ferruginibacter albus TaxID=2875540 RepID=UPI001CC42FD1|nr:DUF3606 domain-containing protein [Ferruginibacter albus]UAY52858.1 DUF3606 domain-containing protein [Ferruginibacter albus]
MSKDLKMKLPSNMDRIDSNDMGEFIWWSTHFGIGFEKLLSIIRKVGNSAEDVRNCILVDHIT